MLAGDTESSFSLDHGGDFYRDVYLVKFDERGEPLWQRNYGSVDGEFASDVDVAENGDILLFGGSGSDDIDGCTNHGGCDLYVLKLSSSGDPLWHKMFGLPFDDAALSGCATSDGGCAVAGAVRPGKNQFSDTASYLLKLDGHGELIWELQRGGGSYDQSDSIIETRDGHIVAVYNMHQDIYIIKVGNSD